jgi:hypothetical protein
MLSAPADLPEGIAALIASLAGGGDVYACTISEDQRSVHLRVFIDRAPYLQVYELDESGQYRLKAMHALGQVKF